MDATEMKKQFDKKQSTYKKIEDYYKGKTDASEKYKVNSGRSNLKVSCNYLKKFVKEETSYSVGNVISYSSKIDDKNVPLQLDLVMENFKENHDVNVFGKMVLFGIGYEILFIDKWGSIQVKAIAPTQGYHTEDNEGNTTAFIHVFSALNEKGESEEFIDLYTDVDIQHLNKDGAVIAATTPHYFGEVPVGVAILSEYLEADTIYGDIKGLQDALETNLSDITNEVSDFRSAYLVMKGLSLGDNPEERATNAENMKILGILEVDENGSVDWLVKNINDSFIQSTLKTLQSKMYELTSHINHNDVEQSSNASGIALKSKLISLMQRCTINQNSFKELLKTRIRLIFNILNVQGQNLNWKDVKIGFTPLIPSDDLATAQMLQQLDGIVSKSTGRTLLSFIENNEEEEKKVKAELEDTYGSGDFGQEVPKSEEVI